MNKLEQAIRKTSENGIFTSSIFSNSQGSSIEEIEKIKNSYLWDKETLRKKKIIYPSMENKKLLNSFRELRSTVTDQYSKNIVMVTSLDENSGTSFFSRNLAVAIAFDGAKTAILIDCNNSKNDVAEVFDISDKKGVSDYIVTKELPIDEIIYESGIKRLKIIPYGESKDQLDEQFSHPRFHHLLGDVKHKYSDRHVIIDAPPILASADARILMNLCDQVIIVLPYGKVSKARLDESIALIGREKFTGVVFNDYCI